jgi:uncharacterized protein YggU (UPF0235/DUF167 family)
VFRTTRPVAACSGTRPLYGVAVAVPQGFIVGGMTEAVRIAVRVKPGSSRTRVGGRYGEDSLVVAVTAKAVDGAATEAVLRAVADALGVPRRAVRLVLGATSRDKVLEVVAEFADGVADQVEELVGRNN